MMFLVEAYGEIGWMPNYKLLIRNNNRRNKIRSIFRKRERKNGWKGNNSSITNSNTFHKINKEQEQEQEH